MHFEFRHDLQKMFVIILLVMKMKWIGYALQNGFSDYVMEHPEILQALADLDRLQREHLVIPLDEQELKERAITYFDHQGIYLRDHTLYYENALRKTVYQMYVDEDHIVLDQKESNPFFPFLQRVFRKFLLYEQEEA